MISVLIVSLGVDIAIRVVEWIGKIWMRRAELPVPPAQGDVTNIAKAGTVIQQPGAAT
jgi:hypothetical protein